MKLKKLFALALAGVMTLALLTGCGDKPGDKPADTLRAEALADIINVRYGKNITCEADPQLSEAAERYTQVSSGEGQPPLINGLREAFVSKGSQARKALLDTIGITPGTANKQVLPEPTGDDWYTARFRASSYRVGFGRWKDENGNPRLFVIMVGDIPGRS